MKHFLLSIHILLAAVLAGTAQETDQPKPGRAEVIEKIIISHITEELNLTVDEAQQFWPVFNQYRGEYHKAAKTHADDPIKRDEAVLAIRKKFKPLIEPVLHSAQRTKRAYREYDVVIIKIRFAAEQRQQRHENRRGNPQPRIEVKRGKQ